MHLPTFITRLWRRTPEESTTTLPPPAPASLSCFVADLIKSLDDEPTKWGQHVSDWTPFRTLSLRSTLPFQGRDTTWTHCDTGLTIRSHAEQGSNACYGMFPSLEAGPVALNGVESKALWAALGRLGERGHTVSVTKQCP